MGRVYQGYFYHEKVNYTARISSLDLLMQPANQHGLHVACERIHTHIERKFVHTN